MIRSRTAEQHSEPKADVGSGVADRQLKSYIDRILRLREEADQIAEDVRGVYAEMKSNGFDKTAAGALVTKLRKRGKDQAKFDEDNAILDLYCEAYDRASRAHTHTHAPARVRENIEQFRPVKAAADHPSATTRGDDDAKSAHRSDKDRDLIDGRRQEGSQAKGAEHQPQPAPETNEAPAESAADEISAPHSPPAVPPAEAVTVALASAEGTVTATNSKPAPQPLPAAGRAGDVSPPPLASPAVNLQSEAA